MTSSLADSSTGTPLYMAPGGARRPAGQRARRPLRAGHPAVPVRGRRFSPAAVGRLGADVSTTNCCARTSRFVRGRRSAAPARRCRGTGQRGSARSTTGASARRDELAEASAGGGNCSANWNGIACAGRCCSGSACSLVAGLIGLGLLGWKLSRGAGRGAPSSGAGGGRQRIPAARHPGRRRAARWPASPIRRCSMC